MASTLGMVASSQLLASQAGADLLRERGNAADAAVAVAAALGVSEPCSTGLGGDMFALYYDAASGKITGLNGSGRAPAALTLDRVGGRLPRFHGNTVTVPGACAGWCDVASRHGSLPLARILAPAIRMAEEGFPVGRVTAHGWNAGAGRLRGPELLIEGRAPATGETFRNPGLARALRAVAGGGKDAFYRGEIAGSVARAVREAGGVMEEEDLAAHESEWVAPISTTYRGVRVWECPPNGQGIVALLALNILEGFDLGTQDPQGADRWHLLVEAMRLAFADARATVADPALRDVPVEALLSKERAARRRALIDPAKAMESVAAGSLAGGSDTVYFCVVDGDGNACSFINSNYVGFGTGIVPQGWGFSLHNRGACFSLDPAHPNALAPRKRPYHTIIPGLLTREDGSLVGPFGVMGGFMQPQGHVQILVGMIDDGLDPKAALDRPRFCIRQSVRRSGVRLEEGLPAETGRGLRARGHAVRPGIGGFDRSVFGRGQIIRRTTDGRLEAGSDRRADGGVVEA